MQDTARKVLMTKSVESGKEVLVSHIFAATINDCTESLLHTSCKFLSRQIFDALSNQVLAWKQLES